MGNAEDLAALEKKLAERRAELEPRVKENLDGTQLVDLLAPVVVDGKTIDRLTVRRVKVRDVLAVGSGDELFVRLGDLAPLLAAPEGIVGELELAADYSAVLLATERALGKYQRGGWSS